MPLSARIVSASFGLAVAVWPPLAATQHERDFVFTDNEGHMILRFAGAEPAGLDADQMEEIVNVSLSTMVHDRLRADALFEAEPLDSHWADSMAPRIRRHVAATGPELTEIHVECRSSTCRLVLEHAARRNVSEHRAFMQVVQTTIVTFIEASAGSFDPVFLMAAYEQEAETPHVKLFLRSATSRQRAHEQVEDPS